MGRHDATTDARDGQGAGQVGERPIRVLFFKAPRCPACGSHRLIPYRTTRHGDVARIRYTRCEQCGLRVHLNIF